MKSALRRLLMCVLLPVVGFGAQAQGDEVLEQYDLALVNLSESMRLISEDVTASRDELDRAAGALRFLAASAGGPNLVEAMERVFERARAAIQNRSSTDLAVQTSLLRGGFQRALYDSALGLLPSERAVAMGRLERLAGDLEFDEETRLAIAAANDAAGMRLAFEAGVAERVQEQLRLAEERYAESKDRAYRLLADAYGDSLLVQDSPRADARLNAGFARAAEGLVGDRGEELSSALTALSQSFGELAAAAQAAPRAQEPAPQQAAPQEASAPGAAAESASGEPATSAPPTDGPDVEEAGAQATTEPAAVALPVAPAEERQQQAGPAIGTSAAPGQEAAQQAAPTASQTAQAQGVEPTGERAGDPGDNSRAATTAADPDGESSATPAAEAANRALTVELIAAGVPARRAAVIASDLHGRGIATLGEAVDHLYALAGRLLVALQGSEGDEADAALGQFVRAPG
jgi:hypothetical protein